MTEGEGSRRFLDHCYHARKGHKGIVYDAIRKHGVENALFTILAIGQGRDYLATLERRAIAVFGTRAPFGYNLTDGGDGAPKGHRYRVGHKHSAEAKAKMSASRMGRVMSEETRAKIGIAHLGNKHARKCL